MLQERIKRLWAWVRELSGDDAYERYLQHHARSHSDQLPMNRQAFFVWQQEKKWNGVRRCC
jgi:uncharacterized short protein YbdD (DUF466 family)